MKDSEPTDKFRLYAECGVCHKDGFFRRKHEHILPNGVKVYSKSFMCKKCRQTVEKALIRSESVVK